MSGELKNEECCPRLNPTLWDGKIFTWQEKRFVKSKVFTVFNVPVNFGSVMKKVDEKIRKAGGMVAEGLVLSEHVSSWKMDLYVAVDKEIEDMENVKLSGKFLSKVYEGSFKETGKWCEDFKKFAESKNFQIKKWYMWYTTCPKCAKKYGKNYVVIMGQIE
jgi:effector-binding domain-containing protein